MSEKEIVEWLYTNAQQGNWRVLIGGLLSAVVWFLRVGVLRPGVDKWPVVGRLSSWLKTDRGGVTLTILVGICGGVGTALAGAHAVDAKLILSGAINGVLGAGVFNVSKRALKPADKKEKRAAISIPLAGLAFFGVLTTGCAAGEFMYRYDQATATAAIVALNCRDTLSEYNDSSVAACRKILDAGDAPNAQKCLDSWKGTHTTINNVCKVIKTEAQLAQRKREVIAALADAKSVSVTVVLKLTKLALEVAETFTRAGLAFDKGGI